jgi:uncharacterized radical SAM superfamily Fe-S cluster-containing enzyme
MCSRPGVCDTTHVMMVWVLCARMQLQCSVCFPPAQVHGGYCFHQVVLSDCSSVVVTVQTTSSSTSSAY